jgi:hypothetical protein
MAQYEQKTDSREFEVANPDPSFSPWSGDARGDASDIVVRLWGPERSDLNAGLTWQSDSVLVYMIADLVGASRGRIAEESPAIMGAHFDGSRQALVAAKRIQTSILEFLACRRGDRVGAAILIYRSRTNDPTGFSAETVQQALRQAQAGQILLAESISERLRDLPGIEFRTVPALSTVMGNRQTQLSELVWATPEQIAQFEGSVGDGSQPRTDDRPAVGATMIVDSPSARRGPTQEAMLPVASTADSVLQHGTETGSGPVQNRAPIAKNLQDSGSSSIREGLDEFEARPLFTRIRVILGLVALVLAAAVIAVLYRPTHISKLPIPPLQEQTGAAESPGKSPDNGTPVTPQPEAKTGQPDPEPAKPAAKLPAVVAKPQPPARPQADNRAKNKKDSKDSAEQPEIVEESGGLSQIDIPKLLDFANADTGNGRYEQARLEYRKVLKLQPSNQEAKEGLKKLDRIQSDRQ